MFEIDHIIPKSISFDDSRNNKVLVYRSENQKKGNKTPYMYLSNLNRDWNYDAYKNYVLELKKGKKIAEKKVQNLLFMQDINKVDVLKGFINRNLNDTRYASKVVLNELDSFFKAKDDIDTKIKVIRGSFTHQMRVNLRIEKDRDASYAHHAVDAMLIAFSQRGYDAFRKIQDVCFDFETGEILNQEKWEQCKDDEEYDNIIYDSKWSKIRESIEEVEKKVKYHYRVDKKCNRALCNQTIYGTRNDNGETYKVQVLNLYDDKDAATLIDLLKKGKDDTLLMYKHDKRTFDDMLTILREYSGEKNPFVAYHKETGDYFRKYAKKHNGPKIEKIKYLKEKVGSCIDISHKYGHEKGSRKVILGSLNPYRTDVYYNTKTKEYYLVGIKYCHIKCEGDNYVIDENQYNSLLRNAGVIGEGEGYDKVKELGIEFKFSLYKNDIIQYEKNGEIFTERFLSRTMEYVKNYIETKPIDRANFEKRNPVGLAKTTYIGKIVTDAVGNSYKIDKEKYSRIVDNK